VTKPGDVVCFPHDIAYDVLVRAEKIRAHENKIFSRVAEGQNIHQITEKGGYF
jgi:4-hydroxy-4-methyl-2-oxoglutarate aldolase